MNLLKRIEELERIMKEQAVQIQELQAEIQRFYDAIDRRYEQMIKERPRKGEFMGYIY